MADVLYYTFVQRHRKLFIILVSLLQKLLLHDRIILVYYRNLIDPYHTQYSTLVHQVPHDIFLCDGLL